MNWRAFGAALLLILGSGFSAYADDQDGRDYGEPVWREQHMALPAYPGDDHLIQFDVSRSPFRYAIDPSSLSIGTKDNVVRYVVVIVSKSGVRNVRYEGIRCDPRSYKTYAYGIGPGPFQINTAATWRPITTAGAERYRDDLAQQYFCDGVYPRKSAELIINRMKNPPSSDYF